MSEKILATLGVKRFDHITIVSKDPDVTTAFYCDLLGMEKVARPDFSFPGRWFQLGDQLVHVNVENTESGKAGMPDIEATFPSRAFHFAFEVDDCDAAAAMLKERGVNIHVGPKDRPDGARQLYIMDPDGYQVEIFSDVK